MKKLLTLTITAILCFGLTSSAVAAISGSCVWEVRTTGDSTNGGGYVSGGTDYSQQDSAQLSLTDLAMTTGGTTLTSATGGFTSAMQGNLIHISSGTHFTAGFYQITGYTDTNTVTIDRDATDGTNATDGVGKVGGALSKVSDMSDYTDGNKVYLQVGSYTDTFLLNIPAYDFLYLIGYNSSRDDFPEGDNRPLWDGDTNDYCIDLATSQNIRVVIQHIRFTGATVSNIRIYKYDQLYLFNTKISNGVVGISDQNTSNRIYAYNLEIANMSSYGIDVDIDGFDGKYGYIHDCGDKGFENTRSSGSSMDYYVFDSNSGYGLYFYYGSFLSFSHNIAYNNTDSGFLFQVNGGVGYNAMQHKKNNISVSNGGYGFEDRATLDLCWGWDYNAYYGNTSGGLSNITAGAHDVTSDPKFTDAAAGDFTLQSSSPLLDAGYDPFSSLGMTGDYKINLSIDQDDNAAGGSSEHSYGFVN